MSKIFISSLAFSGYPAEEMIAIAEREGFAIEFSSGLPYRPDMEELYTEATINRIPHNYFPAPEVPFVLNLASSDPAIRIRSINHCIKGLGLAKESGSGFFSAHAGFCIDPNPLELGNQLKITGKINRKLHQDLFLDSLNAILQKTAEMDLYFYIENNVLAPFNVIDGQNPLLCCDAREILWLLSEVNNSRFGLLLDTAHFKVSCNTFGLDPNEEIRSIVPFIRCLHHSDNDGLKDTNQPMDSEYWFKSFMPRFRDVPHVVEVKSIPVEKIKEQVNLLELWMSEKSY